MGDRLFFLYHRRFISASHGGQVKMKKPHPFKYKDLEPFVIPQNRRKCLCDKRLRHVRIANRVPKNNIFYGMIFADNNLTIL